ncbi:MAG: MCE family protein [Actinomycetota bacterium]
MRLDNRLKVNLVAVLLLAVVTVGWMVVTLVGGVVGRPFSVVADFASTGGVFTDQEVTYRGVVVGTVGSLTLNDDGVDVELLIEPEWKNRIPADVVAHVQSKSAVGEQFVNLTPSSDSEERLAEGGEIPRSRTELPVDFQQFLRSLDAVLEGVPPDATRRVIQNLAGGLGGREEEIAAILRSLGTLSETFAGVATEQKRLLDSAPRAGSEFLRTKDAFAAAIVAADEVFATIGDEPEELSALFRANDRFAREGIALLARHGDNLAGGIDALADFVAFQLRERDEIERSLTYLPQFLHAIEDASIPWRSVDGREFYRIRIGLVYDNDPASWPCKYQVPEDYARLPEERAPKRLVTTGRCEAPTAEQETARSLVGALRAWSREQEGQEARSGDLFRTASGADEEREIEIPFLWPLRDESHIYRGDSR